MKTQITEYFKKPCIISIIGDVNTGKSNMIYYLIEELKKECDFNLYTYGLKVKSSNATEIFSVKELERIQDSIVIVDEFFNIFDLDDRKQKRSIEQTFRLLHHNNNVLILSGLPENFKKFISAKINMSFYKQVTIEDFINGSSVKRNIINYSGSERGTSVLNLNKNEVLVYNGEHYIKYKIPYLKEYDTKKNNKPILCKKCAKKVCKNVEKNVLTKSQLKCQK